ncbi:hypothetical protein AAEP93_003145 [Penicillium crustosum]
MRLFSTAALVAALFATTVIAGMEQLAAVLPSCAVARLYDDFGVTIILRDNRPGMSMQ